MSVREEFDEWATDGRDKGMEDRHWHTAKHALARMPVEAGDTVLDLGCGSGYAGRAIRDTNDAGRVYGLDGSPEMTSNAADYTSDSQVCYVVGDFARSRSTPLVGNRECPSSHLRVNVSDAVEFLDAIFYLSRTGRTVHLGDRELGDVGLIRRGCSYAVGILPIVVMDMILPVFVVMRMGFITWLV